MVGEEDLILKAVAITKICPVHEVPSPVSGRRELGEMWSSPRQPMAEHSSSTDVTFACRSERKLVLS